MLAHGIKIQIIRDKVTITDVFGARGENKSTMKLFNIILLLLIVVPVFEIYLFIKVGSAIGALPTIFLIILTAVVGAILLRAQSFATLARVRQQLENGEIPAVELLEGVVLLVSAAFLLTPGFFTDAVGFLCLVPGVRRALIHWFWRRSNLFVADPGQQEPPRARRSRHSRTIEGEYWRDDRDSRR